MKYESNNFQFEAEMLWESAGEGIVRQIMGYNDNLMMVKVKFETGAIGTPHTHPHTQTTYVASGVFEFTTDGETEDCASGRRRIYETGYSARLHMFGSWCSDRHVQSDAGGFLINGRNPIYTAKVAGSSYL